MGSLEQLFVDLMQWWPVVEAVPYFFIVYAAQGLRVWRRKSSGDLSLVTYGGLFVLNTMWTIYGWFYCDWQYVFSCLTNAVGIAIMIALIIRYRNGDRAASDDDDCSEPSNE